MFSNRERRKTRFSLVRLDPAHEVALADLKPVVAQDVVGSGQVEIEIAERKMVKIGGAWEAHILSADLERDRPCGRIGELLFFESADEIERLVDARLKLGEGLLLIGKTRHRDAG